MANNTGIDIIFVKIIAKKKLSPKRTEHSNCKSLGSCMVHVKNVNNLTYKLIQVYKITLLFKYTSQVSELIIPQAWQLKPGFEKSQITNRYHETVTQLHKSFNFVTPDCTPSL